MCGGPPSYIGPLWRALAAVWLLCGAGCASAPPAPPLPADAPDYAGELVQRARDRATAGEEGWLRLGHWVRRWSLPGIRRAHYQSQADGEAFFLAPQGSTSPAAELEATLLAFFAPGGDEAGDEEGPPVHARCRFPARFLFLSRALDIDAQRLPAPRCERFTRYWRDLDPGGATLVFSSYFMNNPASALGHTFLRINRAEAGLTEQRRELLDTGIDFGADADDGNALIYAWKGVFGMYPGNFRRLPYYLKVRQYSDYESRDLFEYELELDSVQLEMLVAHIWELGSTHFDYYYLDENCSYHVIGALAAAVPDARLVQRMHAPVVPADTVKIVAETPGLVRRVGYRPSLRAQLRARLDALDADERLAVERLAADPAHSLPDAWPDARQVAVLDAAADAVDVAHARELLKKEDTPAAERKRRLLERRAGISVPSPDLVVPPPERKRPERGHGSRRIGVGAAVADDATGAVAFDLRIALHELADPPDGYPDLSQIEFLSARFRISAESTPRFSLDDASLVSVMSLTSFERFQWLPSWKVGVGARTIEDGGCDRCVAATGMFGAGIARAWRDDTIATYLTLDARIEASTLDGIADAPVRASLGPSLGLRWVIHPDLVFLGTGEIHPYPGQRPRALWKGGATLRWRLYRDLALSFEGQAQDHEMRALVLALFYL